MIYDMMYRDGANYKQFFRADISSFPLNAGREEIEMEESGLTVAEFFNHIGWSYDPDYDHNILTILGISEDQDTKPDFIFGSSQIKKECNTEDKFAVDIPHVHRIDSGEWTNLATFTTKEEAIKWAMEKLGADENGMICVISSF